MKTSNDTPVVIAQMRNRSNLSWDSADSWKQKHTLKQLPKLKMLFAAVSLCLGLGGVLIISNSDRTQSVMSHLTAGFTYDETLGRLQFVHNLLPESAMVFAEQHPELPSYAVPIDAPTIHAWSEDEPWLEYSNVGMVQACQEGQIMTVIQNRDDEYTVRIMHPNGYESVYSGLHAVQVKESDSVHKGQQIGTAAGYTAFEWRKDGLSVFPAFSPSDAI